jgi:predicted PurR-regulated permease PerM
MKAFLEAPTPWQNKVIWGALTALACWCIGWVALNVILIATKVISFLQPLLIPFAIAAVLAYLLEPVVRRLARTGLSRTSAVLIVFGVFLLFATSLLVWLVPLIYQQSIEFGRDVPDYIARANEWITGLVEKYQQQYAESPYVQNAANWLQSQTPLYVEKLWTFLRRSLGGFLGVFGFLIGMVITPIYLFYFLKEGTRIHDRWGDYLPLHASRLKDEVVGTINEINGYLGAFFRGQLLVSLIDGLFIGIGLLFLKLPFALLIGLMVGILGLIPYLGIFLCWIPAVLIAAVQFGDWTHPLIVTAIFIGVNQLEGWALVPKIVGNSVGLHPLTVIASVIGWSLLLGGLLGAILAVPLTATLKVLLRRYVWEKQFRTETVVIPEKPVSQSPVIVTARETEGTQS